MTVLAILGELRQRGIGVVLDGRNIRLRPAAGTTLPADLVERVRAAKPALITSLSASLHVADIGFARGPVGEWQRALAGMNAIDPPCAGFRDWPSVLREAQRFLDEHGAEAVSLGWGSLDLFGVHHEVGNIRGDCSGALLGIRGRPVVEMNAHLIRFLGGLTYRRRKMLPGLTIPVWEFGR